LVLKAFRKFKVSDHFCMPFLSVSSAQKWCHRRSDLNLPFGNGGPASGDRGFFVDGAFGRRCMCNKLLARFD
jgi:hypothetical protein